MEENSEKSSRNKVKQSILSKPVKSRISETRMKTQKVLNHNGSQNSEVWMITLQKVTEKGGPTIVSQPSKCLKFMTCREGCFVIRN